MIGRYKGLGSYKHLLQAKELYAVFPGILLILCSYVLEKKGSPLLADLLALGAIIILGGPILGGAMKGILRREFNVDELVALAIAASIIIGEYFSAAIVALIMVLGSLLEQYAAAKARSAIASLIRLAPDRATVLQGGRETVVPVSEIRPGDRLLIRSGEKVPVDGKVLKGEALLNQASLTGESVPVTKAVGHTVYAGTLIYSGMLEIEVTKTGADTALGKLIKLVQEAEQQRAPVLRIADRYARYFTPVIVSLALIVFLLTTDIYRAITVLIVGCPCAFILASPTAIVSALGNASKNGILVKGGGILEEASRINTVLFDKTGTLTRAKPIVSAIYSLNGVTPDLVLAAAAAVERYSTHPLARAITALAAQKNIWLPEIANYKDLHGRGVEGVIGGKKYTVSGLTEEGLAKCSQLPSPVDIQNYKVVVVWEEDVPIGLICCEEELREGIDCLVGQLKDLGVSKVSMVTGDSRAAAAQIAEKAGIEDFSSGAMPEEKLAQVKELQQQGCKVAVVGDGVNDAPALAAADIGIAMGAMGTDAALEAADIALMGDDILKVPYILKLGKLTVKTIKFNIFFAMVFNVLALAASSMGLLNPVSGAIAHNLGSVIVVLNSARLINMPGDGAPVIAGAAKTKEPGKGKSA